MLRKTLKVLAATSAVALILAGPAEAGSIRLVANQPKQMDFGDIAAIPKRFGEGEFTFEIWVYPDDGYPVGHTARASTFQLENWLDADVEPYSRPGWWYAGNWLIDGFTRPEGFETGLESREGSFGLQFYGGGRVRWLFSDGDQTQTPKGSVWAVQAYPATNAPSLLDGGWHAISCVRRWNSEGGADLELWVDGKMIAVTKTPRRTNMRRWWDHPAHPNDPEWLGGWSLGAEVMTAWNYFFNQYEDYKGLVDEMRFWNRAKSPQELAGAWRQAVARGAKGLVGHFDFNEAQGVTAGNRVTASEAIRFYKASPHLWAAENAPLETRRPR